jgi:hypothetical protein
MFSMRLYQAKGHSLIALRTPTYRAYRHEFFSKNSQEKRALSTAHMNKELTSFETLSFDINYMFDSVASVTKIKQMAINSWTRMSLSFGSPR